MKAVNINVSEGFVKLVDVPVKDGMPSLDAMYEIIGCGCIDITTRVVSGVKVKVVCDDEGLLVENPRPSLLSDGHPDLFGNLLLFGANEWLDLRGLNDRECEAIFDSVFTLPYSDLETPCVWASLGV